MFQATLDAGSFLSNKAALVGIASLVAQGRNEEAASSATTLTVGVIAYEVLTKILRMSQVAASGVLLLLESEPVY
jgi:hypothetical protein